MDTQNFDSSFVPTCVIYSSNSPRAILQYSTTGRPTSRMTYFLRYQSITTTLEQLYGVLGFYSLQSLLLYHWDLWHGLLSTETNGSSIIDLPRFYLGDKESAWSPIMIFTGRTCAKALFLTGISAAYFMRY